MFRSLYLSKKEDLYLSLHCLREIIARTGRLGQRYIYIQSIDDSAWDVVEY